MNVNENMCLSLIHDGATLILSLVEIGVEPLPHALFRNQHTVRFLLQQHPLSLHLAVSGVPVLLRKTT